MAVWGWSPAQQESFLRMQFDAQQRHYGQYDAPDGKSPLRIVLCDGQPCGKIRALRTPQQIELSDIALLPEFQGQGIGSRLIRDLQSEATQAGKSLRLRVRWDNEGARRLYARLGFVADESADKDEAAPSDERGMVMLDLPLCWMPPEDGMPCEAEKK